MAIPPSYCDLGKAARDLFEKGFSKYTIIVLQGIHISIHFSAIVTMTAVRFLLFFK